MKTIVEGLQATIADTAAIAAPSAPELSHRGLHDLAMRTIAALNARGFGRGDRIAILLPNGPEMAAAFLAIGAGSETAPLNPAYRADELDFYLSDLRVGAVVVKSGDDHAVRQVAQRRGIPLIELEPRRKQGAGSFDLRFPGTAANTAARPGPAAADDLALLLHTSGTTSRPKIVPLRQYNVMATARHIAATLELSPADRCLNIMPLFHIHGLIAAVLSSVMAGGSVFCTDGFNALKFFGELAEARASWITAVPTMYQTLLARAARNQEIIKANPLRLMRSSSASLPAPVMAELESVFGCPVIESYGMTEAAHQMASNPLPPRARHPGSVGIAAGPDVAIMGEGGKLLGPDEIGEIVIRGANVTSGYEANEKANQTAFVNGWFLTGDQGTLDKDGYLRLTGRLKEIINRGGEKISPREVDDVLMEHPAVAQIVTFAMPHDKLGEDVAAAVVLKEGAEASEAEIREFARRRLADFKVPRKLVFLKEIPKGATGKLQRIGLAEKLGLGKSELGK